MTSTQHDAGAEPPVAEPLVEDYLRRLDTAAAVLPPDRRADLIAGIHEHLEAAREAGGLADEVSTRTLLDRLGDPEEIVAETLATEDAGGSGAGAEAALPSPPGGPAFPAAAPPMRRPGIALEIWAAVMLTAGSLILVVGWLVGVVLLWASRRWTVGEKLLATLVVPGGPGLALALVSIATGTQSCSSSSTIADDGTVIQNPTVCTSSGFSLSPVVGPVALVLWIVLPLVVAGVLLARARRRADLEPPIPQPPMPPGQWGGLEVAAVLLLGLGAFLIPVAGPIAGLVCAWLSDQWTRSEKWVATIVAGSVLAVPLLLLLALSSFRIL